MFVTLGNHEFEHPLDDALLQQRIDESHFYWVASNLEFLPHGGRRAISAANLCGSIMLDLDGTKVGVFGLTTDINTPVYVRKDTDYAEVARRMSSELRAQGAHYVLALTHLQTE